MKNQDNDDLIDKMLKDPLLRKKVVSNSHSWFFYFYFPHYIKYKMAQFHEEMFAITENTKVRSAVIVAFRGSAKSTIFSLSFPIWAILGKQQIKHVLIISGTQQKAQQLLQHIKREFETNHMLQSDLGPFKEEKNEWNTTSLYIPRYDAKITVASTEQSIRSIRFKEHRPQLIILDDIEDLDSVKTKEGRDKVDNWLMGEVIPAGDESTRMMIVGNLLHNDSVIQRLHKRISDKKMNGVYFKFPLLDPEGLPLWPGKYPDQKSIDDERMKGLSEVAWKREYLLIIIPEEDQIIREEYIQYYDTLPPLENYAKHRVTITGVDLAISQKETADYTAAVTVHVFDYGKDRKIYIAPAPLNERLTALQAVERISAISRSFGNGIPTQVWVEDVGYQSSFTELLKEKDIPAQGVKIAGHDKHSRLMTTAPLIQSGNILFPKHSCELLIQQLTGFGVEKHDDLVDALTLIVLKLLGDDSGGNNRLLHPSLPPDPAEKSRDEQEKEADVAAILEQQYGLQVFRDMMGGIGFH